MYTYDEKITEKGCFRKVKLGNIRHFIQLYGNFGDNSGKNIDDQVLVLPLLTELFKIFTKIGI